MRVTGATVHLVTPSSMAGRSCCRRRCRCSTTTPSRRCRRAILVEEHRIYPEAIRIVLDGGWSIAAAASSRRSVMSAWSEDDSRPTARSRSRGAAAQEMMATLVRRCRSRADEPFKILELGAGDGRLAEALLDAFPARDADRRSTDRSRCARGDDRGWRRSAIARGSRAFELATLDWWDRMFGVDLVVVVAVPASPQRREEAIPVQGGRRAAVAARRAADRRSRSTRSIRRRAGWRPISWDARRAGSRPRRSARRSCSQRFVDERWNHFRFPDAADQPSALLHHLVWLSHAGFARGRLRAGWTPAHAVVRRVQAGCSVSTATSGGQLIRTGT